MPRNDSTRLGVQGDGESPPTQNSNSLLNFVMPTEHVELPTQGKFYPSDHPLHGEETVEIRYMTAKETDILSSKDLLKNGTAIDRMLENLVTNKKVKVADLFVGDKNALVIAARINGFGNIYQAQASCPSCAASSEVEFDLNDVKVKNSTDEIKFSENGTFFITLPQTKIEAECKLLTGNDEKSLGKKADKKRKLKLPDSSITDQYKMIIVSLNGVSERSSVEEFVDIMPAQDAAHLRREYDKLRPDVDMTYAHECDSCNAINTVSIPFSANFFWPE